MLRIVTVLALALALPSTAAAAGTVSKPAAGATITWTAPADEANTVRIESADANNVRIIETGLNVVEPECTRVDADTATCPIATGDTVVATAGPQNDTITCVVAACTLDGGAGNDTLVGDAGSQTFTGGDGTDTLGPTYSAAPSAVTVTQDGIADDGVAGEQDNVQPDIETIAGSPQADTITGGPGPNDLAGGAGDDTLAGGDGADVLDGGPGNDVLTGEQALGGDGNDEIVGDQIDGGEGDDVLTGGQVLGGGGNDVLVGDANANRLEGGAGDDRLDGGFGPDTIIGGDGEHDEATYANRTEAVDVTIGGGPVSGNADDGQAGARDALDVERVVGGSGGDQLTGRNGNHGFDGGPGDDVIAARDGDTDTAICGTGSDSAILDRGDFFADDCENVDRGETAPPPSSPPPTIPPPSPPAAPPAIPPPDPPALAVAPVRGQSLNSFLSKGLRVRVTCPGACRARLRILISRSTARKLGIDAEIARGSLRITAPGRRTAVVKASARVKRRLKRSRRLKITIETRITQTATQPTTKRARLTLRRSGANGAGF